MTTMTLPRSTRLAMTVLLTAMTGLIAHHASAQQADSLEEVRAKFVGNYELVTFESFRPDGEVVPRDYVARIMYDPLGNMSAIGMPNDLPQRAEASGDERTVGGFAYFGRAEIDIAAGTVTHQVIGAPLNPGLVGVGRVRHYEFDGDLLTLSIKNDDGRITGQLIWRRVWAGQ